MTAPLTAANRAVRRREAALIGKYRRHAGRELDTALVEAGAPLDGHPHATVFRKAVAEVYRDPGALRCLVCASAFAHERPFRAFLLSCAAVEPAIAAASAICLFCWRDVPLSEIEAQAERVLRRVVPDGVFDLIEAAS
ncbi:hypothetical protein [Bradyrhizobium sp. USDA 3650]